MGKMKIAGERKLVVLSGRTKGMAFVLTKPEVNAGRESDNAICLKGKRVSRYHAVLVRTNGEYTLRDVSPHIGTMLNGKRTKEAALKVGDRIRIGDVEMSYEAATENATAPVIEAPSVTMPAPMEEVAAPIMTVEAAQPEPVADLTAEHQQRIAELMGRLGVLSQENAALMKLNSELQAKISEGEVSAEEAHRVEGELTQETKRLVHEAKLANGALEAMRAQLHTQSELQADLMRRLGAMSQENIVLAKWNSELQAKVSKLETSAREMERVKAELATAQAGLRKMSEELAKARESARAEEKLEPIHVPAVEVRVEQGKISDAVAPAILGQRCVSDSTNEQFDKIRRSIVEKKNLRANMTLLERFMLPFRDTARLVQEPVDADPE